MRTKMRMKWFSREGAMGCAACALQEAGFSREQIQDILDLLAGELDALSNFDAKMALENFYPDEL